MKKTLLIALALILYSIHSFAQDIIYKEDGGEIKTRVLEVGKRSIVYKDFNDPDFVTQLIPVSQITKIRFEDGTEQLFNNNLPRYFLGVTVGGAAPVGDFESTDINTGRSGYADDGPHMQLDFGIYLKKNWAINFNIGGAKNPIKNERMLDPYRGLQSVSIYPTDTNNGNGMRYKSGYFFVGPMYSLRLGKKFLWDFKVLTGVLSLTRTSFVIRGNSGSDNFYNSYEPMKGTVLGFKMGTAIRFNIFKWMGLRLSTEMIMAKPKMRGEVEVSTGNAGGSNVVKERNVFYQKYTTINLGVGLVFMFKR